jgi:hypothetical protein
LSIRVWPWLVSSVGLMAAFGKTDVVCAFVINAN